MCRAVLETEADQGQAEAINDGIVYLMAFPYILVFGVLYFVYKAFQKKKKEEQKSI
jgi:preprotein translocase subunit YajC